MSLGKAYIEIVGDVSRFAPGLRRSLRQAFTVGSLGTTVAAVAGEQLVGLAGVLAQTAGAAGAGTG